MTRQALDTALQKLKQEVAELGELVLSNVIESVRYLKERDFDGSKRLMKLDVIVNRKRFAIENEIMVLIATQQPLAGDLRSLAAMLEIITELERIGDYAKGISKINLLIGEAPLIKPLVDIPLMADKAVAMLKLALKAFEDRDIELAREVPKRDQEVDELYKQVNRELMALIVADSSNTKQANHLLWAAHNLERAADRATNICERVIFCATGKMQELDNHFGMRPAGGD
ncbi:MAG: phosphate signaling complex protein PhoU [Anaerolineae bacterium]|nr:phosphate signaling complex protein PhoU [Anaerolineae bacterium]